MPDFVRLSLTPRILDVAREAGASIAGITDAGPFHAARVRFEENLESGLAGPLGFTYDDPEVATDITASVPWARSLVVFGVSYVASSPRPAGSGPVIGRFAAVDNYEGVRKVAEAVSATLGSSGARTETLIDDSRLADRAAAIRAGVAWLGRSTMALAPGVGPWMLLGTVATDLALEPTKPMKRDCGTCTACIPACPTGAIRDGYLDARRCLSTWLQTSGSIPLWIRPLLGRRIYGCDDCLTSCPPGQPALRALSPQPEPLSFPELLSWPDSKLLERFSWWYVPRREGRYIRRNLLVAAGNSGEVGARSQLEAHLHHSSSMVRAHAAWALARSVGPASVGTIRDALTLETTPEGREEMILALLMLEDPDFYAEVLSMDELATTDTRYAGLGLIGADPSGDELGPRHGLKLWSLEAGASPDLDDELLAGLIRVNDRDRALERHRRRAREKLEAPR